MSWQVGLYVAAVLIPLSAFVVEMAAGRWLGRRVAYVATVAIGLSFLLSLIGFVAYFSRAEGVFEHRSARHAGTPEVAARPADDAPGEFGQPNPTKGREPLAWRQEWDWVALGGSVPARGGRPAGATLAITIGVDVDNLAVLMFLMVTFVATLVHVYSLAYMRDDPRSSRFFAYLSLFCFAMLGLVAASNLFLVFVFWELVGFCSYLLIGFWHGDGANADAANKAFLVNRVGDVGMLIGLGLIWTSLGTFDIRELNRTIRDERGQLNVREVGGRSTVALADPATGRELRDEASRFPRRIGYEMLVVAGLGLFAGCVGKSAQFPLHVWLPDAMAGPTPVSALIHAATMVAAGVYLVGRVMPLFTPEVMLTIAYVGGITLLLAASIAMVQVDYKKVLAYSTVSQLGFMMLGLGVGGRSAGLFHLLTHASFKALLFLGAGSVYHTVHTYDLAVLGGLYRRMRVTALTMLAATLAISGIPPFSGFSSKDAVLASALHFVIDRPGHILLFLLPAIGAAITAFYMFRLWFLLFAGGPRGPAASGAHESERLITWPLIALAVPTVVLGWPVTILPLFGYEPILEQMLKYGEPIESIDPGGARWWAMGASILVASAGCGLGALYYGPWDAWRRLDAGRTARRAGPLYRFLVRKWYFDELYRATVVGPTLALARAVGWFDRRAIDGLVDGTARATERLSRLEGLFDRVAVDRLVGLVASGIFAAGDRGRRLQTGSLRNYLMVLAVAVVGVCAAMFAWVLA